MKNIKNILVVANSARSIVCSAKKAGYTVFAIDRFGDVDTQKCADKSLFIGNADQLYEMAESLGMVDAVILGPGYENLKFKNTLNNPAIIMEKAGDKSKLPGKLERMGIPHPETVPVNRAQNIGFPLMLKPKLGSGGMRNMVVRNEEELASFQDKHDADTFIAQEFVEGIPCSASLISTGDEAVVVALNEQLIGIPWLTRLPFAYCGNITPFLTDFRNEMIQYSEQIALEFGLTGSNGVDFIQTEQGIVVIEVNPRFQGSLDTIEMSTGLNILDAHIRSFAGELPELKEPECFAAKTIMYANEKITIDQKISDALLKCMNMERAADIPRTGAIIQPDEPVTSVLATAKTRGAVLEKVRATSGCIKDMLEPGIHLE